MDRAERPASPGCRLARGHTGQQAAATDPLDAHLVLFSVAGPRRRTRECLAPKRRICRELEMVRWRYLVPKRCARPHRAGAGSQSVQAVPTLLDLRLRPPPRQLLQTPANPPLAAFASQQAQVGMERLPPGSAEERGHEVRVDQRARRPPQELAMTAPPVPRRVVHDVGRHRVQVHVGEQPQQGVRVLDRPRLVACLPQRPEHLAPPVEPLGERVLEEADRAPQRHAPGADGQVVVVRHDAPHQHGQAVPLLDLVQKSPESPGLVLELERRFAPPRPVVHVVDEPLDEHSRPPWHCDPLPAMLPRFRYLRTWHLSS